MSARLNNARTPDRTRPASVPGGGTATALGDAAREIDGHMCSLHRIAAALREAAEASPLPPGPSAGGVGKARPGGATADLMRLETRKKSIETLRALAKGLRDLGDVVGEAEERAVRLQDREVQAVRDCLAQAAVAGPADPGGPPAGHGSDAPSVGGSSAFGERRGGPALAPAWSDPAVTARIVRGADAPPEHDPRPAATTEGAPSRAPGRGKKRARVRARRRASEPHAREGEVKPRGAPPGDARSQHLPEVAGASPAPPPAARSSSPPRYPPAGAATDRPMPLGTPPSPVPVQFPGRLAIPPPAPARFAERSEPPTSQRARETVIVELDGAISLDAVLVPDELTDPREITAFVSTAELYYIRRWDHFAVRVGGVVFRGNVAKIYSGRAGSARGARGRAAVRVAECRDRERCPRASCNYYHDPAWAPRDPPEVSAAGWPKKPPDVRNFLAESWVYAPAGSRGGARHAARRFGSREALEADLLRVTPSAARLHLSQTAHDILCGLILAKYVLGE